MKKERIYTLLGTLSNIMDVKTQIFRLINFY